MKLRAKSFNFVLGVAGLFTGLLIFFNHPSFQVFLIGALMPPLLLGYGQKAYEEGYRKPVLAVLIVYLSFVFLLLASAPACQDTEVESGVNLLTGERVEGFDGFRLYEVCPTGVLPWYYFDAESPVS